MYLPSLKNASVTLAFGLLVLLTVSGCRSTRKIQTAINKKDSVVTTVITDPGIDSAAIIDRIVYHIEKAEIPFATFTGRIKVDYTDNSGKNNNATAFVRIQRDSLMWISLTGPLGIEGFRVLIRPDSVWVMDKLEKTISRKSVESLQEVTQLPVDFDALQRIILGNPVYFSRNVVSFRSDGQSLSALSIGEFFKHSLSIDTMQNQIRHSKLDDVVETRNRTCYIWQDGYSLQQARQFSSKREIIVSEKTKLNVRLEFKQVSFDDPVSFPFNIPKNYKEK